MNIITKDGDLQAQWWLAPRPEEEADLEPQDGVSKAHEQLIPYMRWLRNNQALRRKWDLHHARVYGNLKFVGFGINSYSQTVEDDRLTYNLVDNMIGACVSRITKNSPRATIVTDGQDWSMQNKAHLLEGFVEGVFYQTDMRKKAVDVFRDAGIYGTGALKLYGEGKELKAERVPAWMLTVDDRECLLGEPRNMYESRYADKEVLIAQFAKDNAELAQQIRDCPLRPEPDEDGHFGKDYASDQVLVTEAWHLPTSKKAGDGRHTICLDNCTLVDKVWKRATFPFVFIRWSKAPVGFWGIGLVAKLIGLQVEVNKLLRQIQQSHHLCAWPRMFIPRGAKVLKAQITNMIGAMIEYDGPSPPSQPSYPVVPQEVYNHLQFLIKSAYEVTGISQLTATAQKPAGIDSGIALMNLQDVQSDRFTEIGNAWENMFADAAHQFIDLAAEMGGVTAQYIADDEELLNIDWDDAALETDQYRLQIFPTSMLPQTPVGRFQLIELMTKAGLLQPDEAFALMDMPDLKSMKKRRLAGRDLIDKIVDSIYRGGPYLSPEPYDDLQYAVKRSTEQYQQARRRNAPDHVLSNLRDYTMAAADLLQPPMPAVPPPQAGPPPGAPPGADMGMPAGGAPGIPLGEPPPGAPPMPQL